MKEVPTCVPPYPGGVQSLILQSYTSLHGCSFNTWNPHVRTCHSMLDICTGILLVIIGNGASVFPVLRFHHVEAMKRQFPVLPLAFSQLPQWQDQNFTLSHSFPAMIYPLSHPPRLRKEPHNYGLLLGIFYCMSGVKNLGPVSQYPLTFWTLFMMLIDWILPLYEQQYIHHLYVNCVNQGHGFQGACSGLVQIYFVHVEQRNSTSALLAQIQGPSHQTESIHMPLVGM